MEGHELSQSVSPLQLVQAFQPVSFATSTLRCISRAFDLYNCQCISIKPGWESLVLSSGSRRMALTYFACDIPYTVQASDSSPCIKKTGAYCFIHISALPTPVALSCWCLLSRSAEFRYRYFGVQCLGVVLHHAALQLPSENSMAIRIRGHIASIGSVKPSRHTGAIIEQKQQVAEPTGKFTGGGDRNTLTLIQ
jgi:hypothetical protein